MHPQLFFLFISAIFFFFFFFFFFPLSSSSSEYDYRYSNCSPSLFDCGDLLKSINYPFYGNGRQDYCGYPKFDLLCDEKPNPTITLENQDYDVLNITIDKRNMNIVQHGLSEDTICLTSGGGLANTSFNYTIFSYASGYTNLTLFFGCTSNSSAFQLPINGNPNKQQAQVGDVTCPLDGGGGGGGVVPFTVGFDPVQAKQHATSGGCNKIVNVPVREVDAVKILSNSSALGSILVRGFVLQWSIIVDENCTVCMDSGGTCGYNATLAKPTCFCTHQAYDTKCPQLQGKHLSAGAKVGIAFGCILGAILLLGVCFIIYRRRHPKEGPFTPFKSKGTSISTTPLSRKYPSKASSKDIEKGSTYFGVHVFTYAELEEATHNFNSSKELGDGGFGTVYYGKLKDGREVAVKRLYENNYRRVEQFMNEVEILTRLRHQNLVTLYGCTSRHSRELLLVYEFIPNGTVADHLHGNRAEAGSVTWPTRMSIAIETASALAYLHASDVIHRDVKTTNILLDSNFGVKVADFGLSRLFPNDVTHVSTAPQGTPGYVDPEYHQCYQLTDKSDVYSFGVVLIELISSKPAVDINRHHQDINLANMAINRIQNQALHELVDPALGFETDNAVRMMTTSVAELAFRCLQLEKELRPSMDEVLETLKGIEKEDYTVEKPKLVIQTDKIGLLKSIDPPFSPDSVTEKWVSRSTTPNTSA